MTQRDNDYAKCLREAYAKDLVAMLGCLGMVGGMFVLAIFIGALL